MTTIRNPADIRPFIKETLGHRCSEGVFEHIDYDEQANIPGLYTRLQRLLIGHRMLIYILKTEGAAALRRVLPLVVEGGQAERDRNGYNRLRVVATTECPETLQCEAVAVFSSLGGLDEKVHLHVLAGDRSLDRF